MKRILFGLCLLLFSAPASAYYCAGPVSYLAVDKGGGVVVNIGSGIWTICSLSGTYAGVITKEACAGWYSGMLTAKASARPVGIYFDPNDNGGISTCAGLGNWTSRTPYFLELD